MGRRNVRLRKPETKKVIPKDAPRSPRHGERSAQFNRSGPLEVVYIWARQKLPGLPPQTSVADIRDYMRWVLGIPANASPRLDGCAVSGNDSIGDAITLEFIKSRGKKGGAHNEDDLIALYPPAKAPLVRKRLAEFEKSYPNACVPGFSPDKTLYNENVLEYLEEAIGTPRHTDADCVSGPSPCREPDCRQKSR